MRTELSAEEALRIILEAAYPVLPFTSERALRNMGAEPVRPRDKPWKLVARALKPDQPLGEDTVLFQRV